jgi:hypothetical protein
MCVAELNDTKTYRVKEPEPVGDCETLLKRLIQRVPGEAVLVGFDFPIGLPAAYAELAGVQRFPDVLAELGQGRWADFYEVAREASEISIERPFYPHNPGKSKGERKQEHLLSGLGIDSMNDLLRTCERGTAARGPASSLFWTVGAKQVGKAAIIGWRDILGPAIRDPTMDVALWPFDGPLSVLVATSAVTIAETYPAEACVHLGMTPPGRGWSKTSQSGRKQQRDALLAWCRDRPMTITPNLHELVTTGFGPSTAAEDLFDATIGLLSMLEVVLEDRGGGTPDDLTVRNVEGWILGQE